MALQPGCSISFLPQPKTKLALVKLWVLKIKNTSKKARKLRSFSYIEFSYCDALGDQLNSTGASTSWRLG